MSTRAPCTAAMLDVARDALGKATLVEQVADEHHAIRRRRVRQEILGRRRYDDTVQRCIETNGGERHAVDIGSEHGRGPCFHGRDSGQAGARSQIEHALPRKQRRMVEDIAGQRLAACPGKGPIGRRNVDLAQLFLRLLPDGERFFGEMQQYLGDERWRQGACVGADEGFGGGANFRVEACGRCRHFALAGFFAAPDSPPMRQTSAHSRR